MKLMVRMLAVLVLTPSLASAVDYTPPSNVSILSEQELLTKIVGHSLDGRENKWLEYYEPSTGPQKSGNVFGVWSGLKRYAATWEIEGSLMCWRYPDHPDLEIRCCLLNSASRRQ